VAKEVEEIYEERIKLRRARIKMLEIIDKISENIEENRNEGWGNPYYIEDEE
jgi:hypothetical protein